MLVVKVFNLYRYTDTTAFVALLSSSRQISVYQGKRACFHILFSSLSHYHSATGRSASKVFSLWNKQFLSSFANLRKRLQYWLRHVCLSVCLFVCLSIYLSIYLTAFNISSPTGQIFVKFYICFPNLRRRKPDFIETWQEWLVLYMKTYVYLL